MNYEISNPTRVAILLGAATTLAGVGAVIWRRAGHARMLRGSPLAPHPRPRRHTPVWAQAAAIVASAAGSLFLLVGHNA